MANAKYNLLIVIYNGSNKVADVPQGDVVSLQLTDGINGGSGSGGNDQIVFMRPFNQIGALANGYRVQVWYWAPGTTRPTDPWYSGFIEDFDQEQDDASGKITVYLQGDYMLLDDAIVSETIAPNNGTNGPLDCAAYLSHLLTGDGTSFKGYQPPSFSTPTLPASMFALYANQFDGTKLGSAIDTLIKLGRDTSGALYTWFVRGKANLTRAVTVQVDQNPNVVSGVQFKHIFLESQVSEYKIQTKYRDIANLVAVYGGKDPTTGQQVYGVYQDPAAIAALGGRVIEEKLSVPYILSVTAAQQYGQTQLALYGYAQAASGFDILEPDPTIFAGTWLQINEAPATTSAVASIKQVRCATVIVSYSGERLKQSVQTVSPTPYLDTAIYRMGLEVSASQSTLTQPLPINKQTEYIKAGGVVSSAQSSPAAVAVSAVDAVFPAGPLHANGATLPLVDTSGGSTNAQGGDGAYTVSLATTPNAANLALTPSTLASWNLAGMVLGTAGPSGAVSLDYIGTGSSAGHAVYVDGELVLLVAGQVYDFGGYINPSSITAGTAMLQFYTVDASGNLVGYAGTAITFGAGSTARVYSGSFTPTTTARYRLVFTANDATVSAGARLSFSQPTITYDASAPMLYVVTKGLVPASTPSQQNLATIVVHGGVPDQIVDARTLVAGPLMTPGQSAPVLSGVGGITYPVVGNGTYDAQATFTVDVVAAAWYTGLTLYDVPAGFSGDPRSVAPNGFLPANRAVGGTFTGAIWTGIGAGNARDLYVGYTDANNNVSPCTKVGTTVANQTLAGTSTFASVAGTTPVRATGSTASAVAYFNVGATAVDAASTLTLNAAGTSANNAIAEILCVMAPHARALTSTSDGWVEAGQPIAVNATGVYTLTWGQIPAGATQDLGVQFKGHDGKRSNVLILTEISPTAVQAVNFSLVTIPVPAATPAITAGTIAYNDKTATTYDAVVPWTSDSGSATWNGMTAIEFSYRATTSDPRMVLPLVTITGGNGSNAAGSVTIPNLPMSVTATYILSARYLNTLTGGASSYATVATTSIHSAPVAGGGGTLPAGLTPTPTITSSPAFTNIGYFTSQTSYLQQASFTLPASQTPPGGSASGTSTAVKTIELLRAVTGSGNWELANTLPADPSGSYTGDWIVPKGAYYDLAMRLVDGGGGRSNVSAVIFTTSSYRRLLGGSSETWPTGTTFAASASAPTIVAASAGGAWQTATVPATLTIALPAGAPSIAQLLEEVLVLTKPAAAGDTNGGTVTDYTQYTATPVQMATLPASSPWTMLLKVDFPAGIPTNVAVAFVDNNGAPTAAYPIATIAAQTIATPALPNPATPPTISIASSPAPVLTGYAWSTATVSAPSTNIGRLGFTMVFGSPPGSWINEVDIAYCAIGGWVSANASSYPICGSVTAGSFAGGGTSFALSTQIAGLPAGSQWELHSVVYSVASTTAYDGGLIGTTTTLTVPNAAATTMPSGATFAVSGVLPTLQNGLVTAATGSAAPSMRISAVLSDANTPAIATWFASASVYVRINGTSSWGAAIPTSVSGSLANAGTFSVWAPSSAGDTVDVGLSFSDAAGNTTAIVTLLTAYGPMPQIGGGIIGTGQLGAGHLVGLGALPKATIITQDHVGDSPTYLRLPVANVDNSTNRRIVGAGVAPRALTDAHFSTGATVQNANKIVSGCGENGFTAWPTAGGGSTGTPSFAGAYTVNGKTYTTVATTGTSGANAQAQLVNVKPSTVYSYAALVYIGTSGATARLTILDAGFTTSLNASATALPGPAPGFYSAAANAATPDAYYAGAGGQWRVIAGTFTTPANTTQIQFAPVVGYGVFPNTCYWFGAALWEGAKWQDYVDGSPPLGSVYDAQIGSVSVDTIKDGTTYRRTPVALFDGSGNILASKTTYPGGATVASLQPAAPNADVTSANTAHDTTYVNGVAAATVQGGAARALAVINGSNVIAAALVQYPGGATVASLQPAAANADVTSANTAADTAKVNGVAAATVSQGAARANAGLDSAGRSNAGAVYLSTTIGPDDLVHGVTRSLAVIDSSNRIPSSTSLNYQGSIAPVSVPTITLYGSDTSGGAGTAYRVTNNNSSPSAGQTYGFTRADGSTFTAGLVVNDTSITTAGTYYYSFQYNTATAQITKVYGPSTTPQSQAGVAALFADNVIPISANCSVTLSAGASTTGGSTGGVGGHTSSGGRIAF